MTASITDRSLLQGSASLSISAELSTGSVAAAKPGRRARRIPVELGAALRQRGASGVPVQIADLSIDGFKVASHLILAPGTDVWLRLPGLEPCHAQVMWCENNQAGCAFVRPLHPAVLDLVIAKSRQG